MSPISTMSTVSSSSSTSNSSRASLRSASIVSSCTIPLDEEEEDLEVEEEVINGEYFQDESSMAEELLSRLTTEGDKNDDKLVQMLGESIIITHDR